MTDRQPAPPAHAPVFSYYARTGAASLHARGRPATDQLLKWLDPKPDEVILEIGCGAGHTLALVSSRYGATLYGVDAHPVMLAMCKKRLRYCKLDQQVRLVEASFTETLPFEANQFDAVYGESVLAFQPDEALDRSLHEIHRVLKPGGRFLGNETLWLPDASDAAIQAWNQTCLDHYGILQATPDLKGSDPLKARLAQAGFGEDSFLVQPLAPTSPARLPLTRAERRSLRFTRLHTLTSYLRPGLLKQRLAHRKTHQHLNPDVPLMEGLLFSIHA